MPNDLLDPTQPASGGAGWTLVLYEVRQMREQQNRIEAAVGDLSTRVRALEDARLVSQQEANNWKTLPERVAKLESALTVANTIAKPASMALQALIAAVVAWVISVVRGG